MNVLDVINYFCYFGVSLVSSLDFVAKRYAKALFKAAKRSESTNKVGVSLSKFSNFFQDSPPNVVKVLLDPTISKNILLDCILKVLKNELTIVRNFFTLLVKEGRLNCVDAINSHFQNLLRYERGECIANIWSAYDLSKSFCEEIKKILSYTFNQKILLKLNRNPRLLGGLVIEAEGVRLDASILGTLNRLSHHMKGAT